MVVLNTCSVLPSADGFYYKADQDRLQVRLSERLRRLILSRMMESDNVEETEE